MVKEISSLMKLVPNLTEGPAREGFHSIYLHETMEHKDAGATPRHSDTDLKWLEAFPLSVAPFTFPRSSHSKFQDTPPYKDGALRHGPENGTGAGRTMIRQSRTCMVRGCCLGLPGSGSGGLGGGQGKEPTVHMSHPVSHGDL